MVPWLCSVAIIGLQGGWLVPLWAMPHFKSPSIETLNRLPAERVISREESEPLFPGTSVRNEKSMLFAFDDGHRLADMQPTSDGQVSRFDLTFEPSDHSASSQSTPTPKARSNLLRLLIHRALKSNTDHDIPTRRNQSDYLAPIFPRERSHRDLNPPGGHFITEPKQSAKMKKTQSPSMALLSEGFSSDETPIVVPLSEFEDHEEADATLTHPLGSSGIESERGRVINWKIVNHGKQIIYIL